jgi:hypothetical protein
MTPESEISFFLGLDPVVVIALFTGGASRKPRAVGGSLHIDSRSV